LLRASVRDQRCAEAAPRAARCVGIVASAAKKDTKALDAYACELLERIHASKQAKDGSLAWCWTLLPYLVPWRRASLAR